MKIKSGGGGIDAEGKLYALPENEHEVADSAFEETIKQLFKDGTRPTHFRVSHSFMGLLNKTLVKS